jgi:hypothetical protein
MTSENPYTAPAVEPSVPPQGITGTASPDRERLRKIASAQRSVNYAVLAYLLMIAANLSLSSMVGDAAWTGAVFGLSALVVLLYAARSVYRLASIFRGKVVAVIYVLGMLVPLLGLILLFSISSKASTILQEHGIKVGFLGANPASV